MSQLTKLVFIFFKIAKQHVTLYCNCTSRSSTKTGKFSFFFASTSHLFKILHPPIVINLSNEKIPNSSPFLSYKIQYHTRLISLDEDLQLINKNEKLHQKPPCSLNLEPVCYKMVSEFEQRFYSNDAIFNATY